MCPCASWCVTVSSNTCVITAAERGVNPLYVFKQQRQIGKIILHENFGEMVANEAECTKSFRQIPAALINSAVKLIIVHFD